MYGVLSQTRRLAGELRALPWCAPHPHFGQGYGTTCAPPPPRTHLRAVKGEVLHLSLPLTCTAPDMTCMWSSRERSWSWGEGGGDGEERRRRLSKQDDEERRGEGGRGKR